MSLPRGAAGLAVSNIAWDPAEDDAVGAIMVAAGCTGVEIAPAKIHPEPLRATPEQLAAYRRRWEDRGLRIVAMQGLLFGRPELQLFADAPARAALLDYLRGLVDVGAALGAGALVFGSPRNRQRGPLPLDLALDLAAGFFATVGAHAAASGVALCLEPNPPAYGCDFLTTTAEAVALCTRIDSPGIRVNGDLGAIVMNAEPTAEVIAAAAPVLGHFHVSEPHLAEVGTARAPTSAALAALDAAGYDRWISIEMRSPVEGSGSTNGVGGSADTGTNSSANVAAVTRALRRVTGSDAPL